MNLTTLIKKHEQKLALLVYLACLAFLLVTTWHKWGDSIVDIGRELVLPQDLLSGKLLYRDVFYLYGPFAPYFNAVLYLVLGVRLDALAVGGILSVLLIGGSLYSLARRFLSVPGALLVALTFLFTLAFANYEYQGNYSYLLPYTFASTYGVAFALAALAFFARALAGGSRIDRTLAALGAFLALACRIEMGLMVMAAMVAGSILDSALRREAAGAAARRSGAFLLLPALGGAVLYGFFLLGAHNVVGSNLLSVWRANFNVDQTFTSWLFGTYDLAGNLRLLVRSLAAYAVAGLLFYAGARSAASRMQKKNTDLAFLAGTAYTAFGILLFAKITGTEDLQFRLMPLIAAAVAIYALRPKAPEARTQDSILLSVSLFSFLLMTRMLLNVRAGHYGFYILVPGLVVYAVFFLRLLPGLLPAGTARQAFVLSFAALFVVMNAKYYSQARFFYRYRTVAVPSERGTWYLLRDSRERVNKAFIEFLRTQTRPEESLVVFPEGLTLNYFAGRRNPLYYYTFLPVDLVKPGVEEDIIRQLEAQRVDYAAIVDRRTDEYGANVFGVDYGRKVQAYLQAHYAPCAQFGPPPFSGNKYGVVLLKRIS